MLNETPLRNIEDVRVLDGVVEVRNVGRLFRNLDGMVVAHLSKVPFENHSRHGTRSPRKLLFREFFRHVQFRVEEVRLD